MPLKAPDSSHSWTLSTKLGQEFELLGAMGPTKMTYPLSSQIAHPMGRMNLIRSTNTGRAKPFNPPFCFPWPCATHLAPQGSRAEG
eukprot:192896-Prorocentrum_lima.AAC.1